MPHAQLSHSAAGEPRWSAGGLLLRMEREEFTDDEQLYVQTSRRELRGDPATAAAALAALRALVAGEPALVVPAEDDAFLLKFLRPCKFYPDSAFHLMKKYYEFRATHPQYCRDLVPSRVRLPFQQGVISILSPRDPEGRRYMLIEAGEKWDYRAVPLAELFRGMQLALEAAMAEPRTQVCGVVVIFDMKGLSFGHIMQFTPLFAKMVVDFIQDCLPIRLKGVHVINQPYIFNMLFALFKPFLRDKLRSRIHFHGGNRASLLSHVHASALRARHGGCTPGPEVPGDVMWDMLVYYEEQFQAASRCGYPEKTKK